MQDNITPDGFRGGQGRSGEDISRAADGCLTIGIIIAITAAILAALTLSF